MKYFIVMLFVATPFFGKAAMAHSIAVTVDFSIGQPSFSDIYDLNLNNDVIADAVKAELKAKGYKVADSWKEATNGSEIKITMSAREVLKAGASCAYAVSTLMDGVSNGTAKESNVKRVAFNYSSTLHSYGGECNAAVYQDSHNQILSAIIRWIDKIY